MPSETLVHQLIGERSPATVRPGDPCILVLFGASGDLTKRLLIPALYNLACERMLAPQFAIVGMALDQLTTDAFRARLTGDIQQFSTRPSFDSQVWQEFVGRIHYLPGAFDDPAAYQRLADLVAEVDRSGSTEGNVLFYLATPPSVFGLIAEHINRAGFRQRERGWARLVVEKPFGRDLASALALNRALLAHWSEDQIYRIDHYLGKETVQNLLAFRFANGIFEPLWNKNHVDHLQLTVSEMVGVEKRGRYYDNAGVLRDMIQNHMLQMLAHLCMEPPSSLRPDAVRNEKAKLLEAVRVMTPEDVLRNTVRGQYGPGKKPDGTPAAGYRQEPDVNPESTTETFVALKLWIDNWRWEGVPVYLRSGKSLWQRGTEILVQFKRALEVIFRETDAVGRLESNQLLFHIQPDQGIEFRFQAKSPGAAMALQKVNMRFDYRDAFEASRGTGYEVLLYNCMIGDATLFSRSDLVATAWQIAQPLLDTWAKVLPDDFPNYPAGSWGPKAAFDLLERDGRRWVEVLNRSVLERVPLFQTGDPVLLHNLAISLKPAVFAAGEFIVRAGDVGREMYFIRRGQVEILDSAGKQVNTLGEGDFFGELSLLLSRPRNASVRAMTPCNLFLLDRTDFDRAVKDHPRFASSLREVAQTRYEVSEGSW